MGPDDAIATFPNTPMGTGPKIFRAIAFHFNEARLPILSSVLKAQYSDQYVIETLLTTNTKESSELKKLVDTLGSVCNVDSIRIVSFPTLPNPWLLTWAHKQIMLDVFLQEQFDYYVYTEDDIILTSTNILTWICFNNHLQQVKYFFPSFSRIEYSRLKEGWFFVDFSEPINLRLTPYITLAELGDNLAFYSLKHGYQAMFMYNRVQMKEYIESDRFVLQHCSALSNINHPTWGGGGVAEASAYGISTLNVPQPFLSRNLLPIFLDTGLVHPAFLVHHATNIHVDNPTKYSFGEGTLPIHCASQ